MRARRRRQHEAAETARIVEPKRAAAVEVHVDVIVRAGRQRRRQVAQAARHAEMHEQRAGVGAEQQVFGAPLEAADARVRERARQPSVRRASAGAARAPRRARSCGRRRAAARPRRVVSTSGSSGIARAYAARRGRRNLKSS